VAQPVDSSILHEIVRVIESRRKVPEKVIVKSREYLLTYLEDHQRRLEDALSRYDADRLNMLYGQLASKIKYQLLRRIPGRAEPPASVAAKKPVAEAKRTAAAAPRKSPPRKKPAARAGAAQSRARKAHPVPAAKRAAAKRRTGKPAKSTAKRRK
jgi:hypothetical protein